MSHYSKIFNKVPVDIPNKSGFDMSHENLFTGKCGQLIPCMVDELLPNDSITLGVSSQIQLPPMATDFYGRVQAKFEAFFVPNRILFGGWQELITHDSNNYTYPSGTTDYQKSRYLPTFVIPANTKVNGQLPDYLGVKLSSTGSAGYPVPNPLPFVAYHKIWEDWYRDSRIQSPAFQRSTYNSTVSAGTSFKNLPYVSSSSGNVESFSASGTISCADNVPFYQLRQRNWARDYFTNATTQPQAGYASSVSFSTSGDTGSFSISSLRAANALQLWLERNNIAGYRYGDQIKAQFGVYPSDAVTDRSIYLGSKTIDVYNKSVYQQSNGFPDEETTSRNPMNVIGAKYGSSMGVGDGSLVDKFTATEHGFIFVMFSLVPIAAYATGTRRYLMRNKASDFAFPLLAGIGDQEIYKFELNKGSLIDPSIGTFGYTQRYSEYKYMDDEVHGLLSDGQSLSAFALQRSINGATLGSSFLQIPTDYLDQVTAVEDAASDYGCWVDSYFKYKKSSTLPAYSIPSLGDLHDVHTEMISNGGKRL